MGLAPLLIDDVEVLRAAANAGSSATLTPSVHLTRGESGFAHDAVYYSPPTGNLPKNEPDRTKQWHLVWVAPPALLRLLSRYGGYCEALFVDLARQAHMELFELLGGGSLDAENLAIAAKALGRLVREDHIVVPALLPLLHHADGMVREFAAAGLSSHPTPAAKRALKRLADTDPNPGVSRVAREILEDFDE